jgi:hypothetical protein
MNAEAAEVAEKSVLGVLSELGVPILRESHDVHQR